MSGLNDSYIGVLLADTVEYATCCLFVLKPIKRVFEEDDVRLHVEGSGNHNTHNLYAGQVAGVFKHHSLLLLWQLFDFLVKHRHFVNLLELHRVIFQTE